MDGLEVTSVVLRLFKVLVAMFTAHILNGVLLTTSVVFVPWKA